MLFDSLLRRGKPRQVEKEQRIEELLDLIEKAGESEPGDASDMMNLNSLNEDSDEECQIRLDNEMLSLWNSLCDSIVKAPSVTTRSLLSQCCVVAGRSNTTIEESQKSRSFLAKAPLEIGRCFSTVGN